MSLSGNMVLKTGSNPKIIEKFKIGNLDSGKRFLELVFGVESIFGTFRAIGGRFTNYLTHCDPKIEILVYTPITIFSQICT